MNNETKRATHIRKTECSIMQSPKNEEKETQLFETLNKFKNFTVILTWKGLTFKF